MVVLDELVPCQRKQLGLLQGLLQNEHPQLSMRGLVPEPEHHEAGKCLALCALNLEGAREVLLTQVFLRSLRKFPVVPGFPEVEPSPGSSAV